MKLTKRKAFNFLRSYFDVYNKLQTNEDKLSFLDAVINKQFLNEDPKELKFPVDLAYESQLNAIDSSVKGWIRANNTDLQGKTLDTPPTPPKGKTHSDPKEEEEEEKGEEEGKEKYKETPLAIAIYFSDEFNLLKEPETQKWFVEFLKGKKKNKGSLSEIAIRKNLNKLKKLSNGNRQVARVMIQEASDKGWKDFYKLKQEETTTPKVKLKIYNDFERS